MQDMHYIPEAFSLLIENLEGIPLAVFNQERHVCQANIAFLSLFALEQEELQNVTWEDILYRQRSGSGTQPCPLEDAFLSGEYQEIISSIQSDSVYKIEVFPLDTPTRHVLWLARNITEEIRNRDTVQESQSLLEALFENSPNLMFIIGQDKQIKKVNKAALAFFNLKEDVTRERRFGNAVDCIHSFFASQKCGLSPQCKRCRITELAGYTLTTGTARNNEDASITIREKGENHSYHFLLSSTLMKYQEEESVLLILSDITEQRELEKTILNHIIKAEEQEKEQLAAALHDEIGPILSGIKLYANDLEDEHYEPEERHKNFKNLESLIDLAVQQTKAISNNLMPHILVNFGLVEALDDFCMKINAVSKVDISFQATKIQHPLSNTTRVVLYRAVIELVNNTLKHADASAITIKLEESSSHIRLHYTDNGKGFKLQDTIQQKHGLGVLNLLNRLKSIDAQYYFSSQPGEGIRYEISLETTRDEEAN